LTTRRISQIPASSLSRVVSNFCLVEDSDPGVVACWARFVLVEYRVERQRVWAGRVLYRLREVEGVYRLIEKRVVLVDRMAALDTFTFIL
ncbi:aromatic-ring-hydroxylating dioxygenase subunit beta, partial [Actinomycetospora sp. C-140]